MPVGEAEQAPATALARPGTCCCPTPIPVIPALMTAPHDEGSARPERVRRPPEVSGCISRAIRATAPRNRIRSTRGPSRSRSRGDYRVVADVSVDSVRRCFAPAAAAFGARARRPPNRSHPGGRSSLSPRPAPVARVGVRGDRARTDDRSRARPAGPCRVAQRPRRRAARPSHGRASRDRRRWRRGAVPAWAERRHPRSARGGADGLHGRAPARRPDAGSLRRLDGEHLCSGPARGQRLSNGSARGAAVVPRPCDGRNAVYRVRGPGRPVDRS